MIERPPTTPLERNLLAMGFSPIERDKIISVAQAAGMSALALGSFLTVQTPIEKYLELERKMEWIVFDIKREGYLRIWACIMLVILVVIGMMR